MKIKYLAIVLLAGGLLTSPLLAKDKVKPVKTINQMDKASPANMSVQLSSDELEVAKKKAEGMSSETEVIESKADIDDKGTSGMATGKRTHEPVSTTSATAYLKIDDIKGETSRAADEENPDRIDFKSSAAPANHNTTRSNKTLRSTDSSTEGDTNKAATVTDYNSSRSNKADGVVAPDENDDADEDAKATDYNSSRSNKSFSAGDLDKDVTCDEETEKKVCKATETHVTCSCTHL